MMVMSLRWVPVAGKEIRGGERWLGFMMSGLVDASVDGAAQVRWTTSRQEQDKPHKVFFDTYL
jgi:hypothetical protein